MWNSYVPVHCKFLNVLHIFHISFLCGQPSVADQVCFFSSYEKASHIFVSWKDLKTSFLFTFFFQSSNSKTKIQYLT